LISSDLSENAERYYTLQFVLDSLEELFQILSKLSYYQQTELIDRDYLVILEEMIEKVVQPLACKYKLVRSGAERFYPDCLLHRELAFTLAYAGSFKATHVTLLTGPLIDDYEEDDEDENETRMNKQNFVEQCFLLTQSLENAFQNFERQFASVYCTTDAWNDINYDMLSVATNIPALQFYFPCNDCESYLWLYNILCCYRQVARCIFYNIRNDDIKGTAVEVKIVTEWRILFERIISMSHEGKLNKDIFLIGLIVGNVLEYWRNDTTTELENMRLNVHMMGFYTSLWSALCESNIDASLLTPVQMCLHEIELKLVKIQLMVTKLKHCQHHVKNDNEALKQRISGPFQDVSRRMDCIPWESMISMVSLLKSEASKSDALDSGSKESNLTLLSAFVFWVETLLEITLMRSEAIGEIDLCRDGDVSFDQSFLEKWLHKFGGIHEKALTITRLFSYFQDYLVSENCDKDKALIWLSDKVSSSYLLKMFCNDDKKCVIEEVACLAHEWHSEYRKVIVEQVQGQIDEVKNQGMNKAFALFV
jgi:hypothetical protein